jgi:hypothetical protein
MIIAATLVVLGLLAASLVTYTKGYRLCGVVIVPLLAVYTLIDFATLPIFALSGAMAFGAIAVIQRRRIQFNRGLLIPAILVGMIAPAVYAAGLDAYGSGGLAMDVAFVGSVLPGIAAYNLHRQDPDRRLTDLAATSGLLIALLAIGTVAGRLWTTPPCWSCQVLPHRLSWYVTPVILAEGTDVAPLLGLTYDGVQLAIGTVSTVLLVIVAGILLSELPRYRWGIRPVGVISIALLALFALQSWVLLALYLIAFVIAYPLVTVIHRATLVYGRVLLSVGIVLGVLFGTITASLVGLEFPFSALMTGLLAGVGAYNLHVVPRSERPAAAAASAGVFVLVFGIARLLVTPQPSGLAADPTPWLVVVGVGVMVIVAAVLAQVERPLHLVSAGHRVREVNR